ncbi:MAG: DNA-processing protein DprA [Verrucomicrobiota bacterium]
MTRTECYLALNSVHGIGPVRVRKLLEAFETVENIFQADPVALARVDGIGKELAQSLCEWEKHWDLAAEWAKIKELGLGVIDRDDPKYPHRLREIYDPPMVLYYKGDLEVIQKRCLAIVGSRHTTSYGFETARKLSYQSAYAGLTIVSGLARGIDTAAHQGALAAKGRTAAIYGCSLDMVFPQENRPLTEKIVESGGALISEFCLGTTPDKYTFPMRNRIISGLSDGVLVVEAGQQSGAIITARLALDQGRQVFAVPGRVDNPHARGCHSLLKEGARLVEDVDDIFNEFELLFPKKEIEGERKLPTDLSPEELAIFNVLENDDIHIDAIIRKCGLPSAVVSSSLLRLELKRLVRQLPGKFFIKTA